MNYSINNGYRFICVTKKKTIQTNTGLFIYKKKPHVLNLIRQVFLIDCIRKDGKKKRGISNVLHIYSKVYILFIYTYHFGIFIFVLKDEN